MLFSGNQGVRMVKKKLAILVLVGALLSLGLAPDILACRRHYRVYRTRPVAYHYAPHARVVEVVYYHHHNHSTRNKILSVLAPAAVGAGIGALAGGGKGAGIGALAGGGAGAAYYVIAHRHHRY
jgi:uncharacterized protein YcfJ